MKLQTASLQERMYLSEIRAGSWRGKLTTEEFIKRNEKLYAHPYGKTKIQTLVLTEGEILTSMDVLTVPVLVLENGKTAEKKASLIASVFTPQGQRGKGYARRLFQTWMDKEQPAYSVLFSDIAPEFYKDLGYRLFPSYEVFGKAEEGDAQADGLSLDAFVSALRGVRRKNIEESATDALCCWPDAEFVDWVVEKYRYYYSLGKTELPKNVFFRRDGTVLACLPNAVYGQLDCLYASRLDAQAISFMSALAKSWGFAKFRYWTQNPSPSAALERPMLRCPSHSSMQWIDCQLCDWW